MSIFNNKNYGMKNYRHPRMSDKNKVTITERITDMVDRIQAARLQKKQTALAVGYLTREG